MKLLKEVLEQFFLMQVCGKYQLEMEEKDGWISLVDATGENYINSVTWDRLEKVYKLLWRVYKIKKTDVY